ncbi:biopolymer transport protein ExbD [Panacagrimonas perspica]|uniref:Biopolymer transport protein ExbD n=2 Tax=Gammaproteobacteria TaxID=1236 RepID=A0A4V3F5Y4_9GAMM|nr:biopolymer transporter ExbD [Panacagrimonas perspica]TDU30716.1 biopolymer transport protein ExbD [Panacagrimonas perspica]
MNAGARRARKIVRELRREAREGELNVVSLIDIFAILVFYLLVNALVVEILPSPKALQLPESIAKEDPKQTVLILITPEDIIVDTKRVMSTADAAASTTTVLPDLKYKLNEETLMQVDGAGAGQLTRGDVNIMADKSIPFHVLKKVMATCSDTRFAKISLAVIEKEGAEAL